MADITFSKKIVVGIVFKAFGGADYENSIYFGIKDGGQDFFE